MMDGIRMDGKTTDGMLMVTTTLDGKVIAIINGIVICPTAVRPNVVEEAFPCTINFSTRRLLPDARFGPWMVVLEIG